MTTQEYEAMLDPQYVANQQWEWEEMQKTIEQQRVELAHGQQVSHGSAQTARVSEPPLQNSTVIAGESTQGA